ncbi:TRAP transporter small permease [Agromyces seonyuensis]|uniref:TRAP transporter small permease subunit n=1 Tax=Agromyces seonyuensis TaxID=2662446 RepID=A0A6I4P226_9MICO|nr:TRAP transporter small permease subunit [Agromyces seonyuensis]MWB97214.1 TRAP transporter small permease subunit [Agromyces seonyuensis]
MPDEPVEPEEPERTRPPDGGGAGTPNDTDQSIFGHTDSFYAVPELNRDAPRDPLALRWISKGELAIAMVLFAIVFIGVMYQVLGRYVPQAAWIGAGEAALLSMIALTFITTGYLVGRNGHIVLEIFDGLLAGTKLFVALRVVSAVIMVLICLALSYEAVIKIDSEWARASAAMRIPQGAIYVFALIGFVSGALNSAWKIPYANRPERKLELGEMDV